MCSDKKDPKLPKKPTAVKPAAAAPDDAGEPTPRPGHGG